MNSLSLVKGEEIELIPEGYVIRLKVALDGWKNVDRFFIEVGVFPTNEVETLSAFLTKLVGCLPDGESDNALKAYKLLDDIVGWPRDIDNKPAWLEDFSVIYSDGKGHRYQMIRDKE